MSELTADDIRSLPLPDLALKVLAKWGGYRSINNLLRWMEQDGFPNETDLDLLMMRVADAWSSLKHMPSSRTTTGTPQVAGNGSVNWERHCCYGKPCRSIYASDVLVFVGPAYADGWARDDNSKCPAVLELTSWLRS